MAIGPSSDEADEMRDGSFDVKCLLELLSFAPEPADVIWADDRYINGYLRRDTIQIVSIVDN
jgi:hypothetical protein